MTVRTTRRQLLAALTGAAASSWLTRAFAASPEELADALAQLELLTAAWQRAHSAARPLLVLVVPDDLAERWDRGRAWGAWLNHAPDDDLLLLSEIEVVAATWSACRQFLPQTPIHREGTPWMLVVHPDRVGARVRILDLDLPPGLYFPREGGDDTPDPRAVAAITQPGAALARALPTLRAALLALPPAERAERIAATRTRLVQHRIPGSKWGHNGGCGTTIEGEDQRWTVGCGMGYVPREMQRLLLFDDEILL